MQIVLEGKNALVGGSSKGLGWAIATSLAAAGAQVTLMARDSKSLAALNGTPLDWNKFANVLI